MPHDSLQVKMYEFTDGTFHYADGSDYSLPDQAAFLLKLERAILRNAGGRLPIWHMACPFCRTKLVRKSHLIEGGEFLDEDIDLTPGSELDPELRSAALEVCKRCTYWRWHHLNVEVYGSQGLMARHEYHSAAAKLAEFSMELPDGCSEELAIHLRRKPEHWRSMAPHRLETLVAEIIRANYAPIEVQHVGGTNDGGVDLVWVQSSARRWLVQVKRRSSLTSGEGVATIRNLLGAMVLQGSAHGIVVSSADHFTYMAHQAVGRAAEVGMTVKLADRHVLDRLLSPLLPVAPWRGLIERDFPHFGAHFEQYAGAQHDPRQFQLFPDNSGQTKSWSARHVTRGER